MSNLLVTEFMQGGRIALQRRALQRVVLMPNYGRLYQRAQVLNLVQEQEYVQLRQRYPWINDSSSSSYSSSNVDFRMRDIQDSIKREQAIAEYNLYSNKVDFYKDMLWNVMERNPMMNMDGNLSFLPTYMDNCLSTGDYKGIDGVEFILGEAIKNYFGEIKIDLAILDREIKIAASAIEKEIFLFLLFQHEAYYIQLEKFYHLLQGLNNGELLPGRCFEGPKPVELNPTSDASKALALVKNVQKELMLLPDNQKALTIIARKPQALAILKEETKALTIYKERCTSLVLLPTEIPPLEERPVLEGPGIVQKTGNFLSALWNAGRDYETLKTLYEIKSNIDSILEGVSATAIDIGSILDGISIVSYLLKGSYGIYQAGGVRNWSKMILRDMVELKKLLKDFPKNPNAADFKKILLLIAGIIAFLEMLKQIAKKVNEKEIYDDWKKTRDELSEKLDGLAQDLDKLKKDKTTHATTIEGIENTVAEVKAKIDAINEAGAGRIAAILSALKGFFGIVDEAKVELAELKLALEGKSEALKLELKKLESIEDKIERAEAHETLLLKLQSDSDWASIFAVSKVYKKALEEFNNVCQEPTLAQVAASIKSVKSIGITKADLDKLKQDIQAIS